MIRLLQRLPAVALIAAVRGYQYSLAAFFGPACRYEPSCSHYAVEAVRAHGALAGGWLAVKRLARCHPWGGCGYDPVPEDLSRAGAAHRQDPTTLPGRG